MSDCQELIGFVRRWFRQDGRIPLHEPRFVAEDKARVLAALESTYVSTAGPCVDEFERRVADYTGAAHAIATVNGTAALHVSLLLAGVAPGDVVLTQALSFVATANAIHYCGAEPAFIDVERATLGLSPARLEQFLAERAEVRDGACHLRSDGRRIAACVPMHALGHPARIDAIAEVCARHGIALVEDAAEALGSLYRGRHAGRFGRLGVLSFNGNKIITTGGGGMILTDDAELARRALHLTTTAKLPHPWLYQHDQVGYNYRLPNLNAALGCAQMAALPRLLESKRELAREYLSWGAAHGFQFLAEPEGARSNYWLNGVVLKDERERDGFLEATARNGIMTRPLWMPLHRLPMYAGCLRTDLAVTERLAATVVNVPSSARP